MSYKQFILMLLICFVGRCIFSQDLIDTMVLSTFKVSAEKLPESLKTTYLDSSAISQSINLSELLSNHSPVFVKTYGSGSLASVSFRGTGASHTSVLWNGVALNSPMNGQVDFSLFPTPFFNGAELNYGASGLINGNGALGGSVNLSNQVSFTPKQTIVLKQSIGSFSHYNSTASVQLSNNLWHSETTLNYSQNKNNFEYTNIALSEQPILEQLNAFVRQYGFQQSIFRKLKNSQFGIRLWYYNSDRELPASMLNNGNNNLIHDEEQRDESFRLMGEWSGFKKKFDYKLTSAYLKDHLVYTNSASNIYSESNSQVIDNKLSTNLHLNGHFKLMNKLSVRYEQANADGYNETHQRYNNHWVLGLNYQYNRLDVFAFNRAILISNDAEPLAPGLGIRYSLLKSRNLKLKANTGINYNYPTFNDLYWSVGGNPDLKPEKAEMYEGGIAYSIDRKNTNVAIEATSFYSHVYNWIIWAPNNTGIWSPENLKEVENKGIELSTHITTKYHSTKLFLTSNYAYTISTNLKAQGATDNSVNKQLIYVPYHQLNYSVGIEAKGYRFTYHFNYTGKRFITTDNSWYLPANFLSNVELSKHFSLNKKLNLKAGARINNLFDQQYQAMAWRAMPGRNYLFNLAFIFNQ